MRIILLCWLLCLTASGGLQAQSSPQKEVVICWDTSASRLHRDSAKEERFLQEYFSENPNAEVTLLLFNTDLVGKRTYRIEGGDWNQLKNELGELDYDGATSYQSLSDYGNGGDVLLFTDGYQNINIANPIFDGNVTIVNSSKKFDKTNLALLTVLNKADYVNLSASKNTVGTRPSESTYFGKIYNYDVVEDITISIKDRYDFSMKPNADGSYRLNANPGDVLVVTTSTGAKAEKLLGVGKNIDVWLEETGIRLDEVVLTEEKEQPQEGTTTGLGVKNKDAVGYAVQTIGDEEITEINTDIATAVQGKFSGVTVAQNQDLTQAEIRPKSSILSNNYGLVVIDGVPMSKSNSSFYNSSGRVQSSGFINPNDVANITVLKGLAATNRYGSLGSNGVILIETKTASFKKGKQKKDLALLTDNVFEGKLKVGNKLLVTPYLKELKKEKDIEQAYRAYLKQRHQYAQLPEYFIDISDFFRNSNVALANRVLSNVLEQETPDLRALGGMRLKAETLKDTALQFNVATKVLELYPNRTQAYLDMALAHKNIGDFQTALDMLGKIADGSMNTTLDFSSLDKIVGHEIRNLIFNHKKELDLSKVDPKFMNNIRYDARLVFEWSNQDGLFELQFVNPSKRFFTWEHTEVANRDRLRQELEYGNSTEQFEISGDEFKGSWTINVKYLGNKTPSDKTATFLKCTVQYQFGKPGQRSETHIIRLQESGSEIQFLKLNIQ
ncbi:TonB-dependent receptor plug domain-containing protein [Spongiimicrobium sp. 3-5]|uniref:TonB-dependent receptor plug domain-containing protein n=1 Tax=Spongiimicrobium sp. 3-5 TaxID=3332596 RepID=UPI0039815EE7